MVAKTDQKARLLDLVTGVLELTRDGKRDVGEVADVLQVVKDDPKFARRLLSLNAKAIDNFFRITCEGSYKISELVRQGNYNWVNDWITDERFPVEEHAPVGRTIELIEFDYDPNSAELLSVFAYRGLERPTYEDALYFGIKYPEEQRKRPIVFLHEPVLGRSGSRDVLVLNGSARRRGLDLDWFGWWRRHYVFAGVRK